MAGNAKKEQSKAEVPGSPNSNDPKLPKNLERWTRLHDNKKPLLIVGSEDIDMKTVMLWKT
jgi:hypothetical protein